LRSFAILSEQEKSNYLSSNIFLQQSSLSLLYNGKTVHPFFYKENYDLQLFIKSLLLTDTRNVLQALRNNSDSSIQKKFNDWQSNKISLAKQYAMPEIKRREDLAQIEKATEDQEKELVRLSAAFRNMRAGMQTKTKDILDNLLPDEAAIEFVSFQLFNKEVTDSVMYGALILKKSDSIPAFVPLFEESQLVKIMGNAGKTSKVVVNALYPGKTDPLDTISLSTKLYQLIWQPMESHLSGIKTISYSPAGKLHEISFAGIAVDNNKLLSDLYELHQYGSTKEIAGREIGQPQKKPANAVLIGNPAFDMDSLQMVKNKKTDPALNTIVTTPAVNDLTGPGWENLSGTEEEVKKVKKLFDQNKIPSKLFINQQASEETIKRLGGQSPQELFIATHGFFLPAKKTINKTTSFGRNVITNANDPLLRSGLVLAGGNYVWNGKAPIDGVEDGILTANEISQLDLQRTDLVVLSACETALGDIGGTEGVFGLQRAFKMAGVNKMIVSLWKVPDKETAELMVAFHTYWLNGLPIEKAFAKAQQDLRKKYAPYYWAAFVLIE